MGATQLHNKIRSMCTITRRGDDHWLLEGCKTIWIPEIQQIVTTRRAAYAAFVGPISEGWDVVPDCGITPCISPYHAKLREGRSGARPLSLQDHVAALASPSYRYDPKKASEFPKGVTPYKVQLAKALHSNGNGLAMIARAAEMGNKEVIASINGVYDDLLRSLSPAPMEFHKGPASGVPVPFGEPAPVAEAAVAAEPATIATGAAEISPVPEEPDGISEEESEWLKMVWRG